MHFNHVITEVLDETQCHALSTNSTLIQMVNNTFKEHDQAAKCKLVTHLQKFCTKTYATRATSCSQMQIDASTAYIGHWET